MNPIDEYINNLLEYDREQDTCEICGAHFTERELEYNNDMCFKCFTKHKEAEEALTRG